MDTEATTDSDAEPLPDPPLRTTPDDRWDIANTNPNTGVFAFLRELCKEESNLAYRPELFDKNASQSST